MRRALTAVSTVLMLSACAASAGNAPGTTDPAATPDKGSVAAGSITLDGVERSWLTYSPGGPPGPAPVLLVLHGSGDSGAGLRSAVGPDIEQVADQHGFTVVYVDGYRNNWNECRVEGRWPAKADGMDDVALMHEVVASLGTSGPVYAVGFSSGGHMAMRLALEASDLVDGAAAVAANPPVAANQSCDVDGGPVPIMFVEGRDDPINPVHGGEVRVASGPSAGSRGEVMSATDGARWYARHNDVAPGRGPVVERSGGVESTEWSGPDPVRLVVLDGTGHTFPTASGGWGPSRGPHYDAPGEIWHFFAGS